VNTSELRHYDSEFIHRTLTWDAAVEAVRAAMIALSDGRAKQLLRSFIGLETKTFAIMPAALSARGFFGAKLVSVFFGSDGRRAHEGLVVLFDGDTGKPVCTGDASAITRIRTAAASAAATDALARRDASIMAVLGIGKQAESHIDAIAEFSSGAELPPPPTASPTRCPARPGSVFMAPRRCGRPSPTPTSFVR
jgi:ornithine cyclodeaminase/alanine dehydrogenase-like protein (mu-crystallin family)